MMGALRRALAAAARPLRRSREPGYRFLAEQLEELIVVTSRDGVIQYTSHAFNALLGYGTADCRGRTWSELLAPDHAPAVHLALSRAAAGLRAQVVCRLSAADGRTRWVECHFGAADSPELVAVCYDLDRLVAAERELAVARAHHGGQPELLELGALVNGMLPVFRAAAPEGVVVALGARELTWVWDDPERLRQAVLVLVERACGALLLGGIVRMRVCCVRADRSLVVAHQCLAPGAYARLDLVLEGYGISLGGVVSLVGDGGGPGDAAREGLTGWLAAMGGGARVERRPGHDPVVSVYLPLSRVASAAAMPQPRTVLVAGDDPGLRGVVGRILELEGYQVVYAADAAEAALMLASAEVVVAVRGTRGDTRSPRFGDRPVVRVGGGAPAVRTPVNPAELVRAVERAASPRSSAPGPAAAER